MSLRNVLENLSEAGVSVWLGRDGALRIDSGASEEVKKLVRENKQALIDLCRAQEFVNAAGLRLVRMPMGGRGVAHPPGGRGGDLCGERPETSPTRSRRSPGSVVGGQGENGPSGLQWCSPCPQNDVFLPHKNARFYGLKTA